MASQLSFNVCLLDHPDAPCYSFDVPEGAKVQDLQEVIRASRWMMHKIKDEEDLLLFKCGDLNVLPEEDLFSHASIWICEHYNNNNKMARVLPLQQYFPTGPAAASDGKVDIIAVTIKVLATILAQSDKGEFSTLARNVVGGVYRLVTFKIRHDDKKVDWDNVEGYNGFSKAWELPTFIQGVVDTPRSAGNSESVNKIINVMKDRYPDLELDPKLLSTEENAVPYEAPGHELLHYHEAVVWANMKKITITLWEAYDVVLGKFRRYWCENIHEAEYRSNQSFPFSLIVENPEESSQPSSTRPVSLPLADLSAKQEEYKYTPRPDAAFLKDGLPRVLVEFDSKCSDEDRLRLLVLSACALCVAAACRRAAGNKDNKFFLMGVFIRRHQVIYRYFFWLKTKTGLEGETGVEGETVRYHERQYMMDNAAQFTNFLFEFYNYARYVKDEGDGAHAVTERFISMLQQHTSAIKLSLYSTKRARTEDHPNPRRSGPGPGGDDDDPGPDGNGAAPGPSGNGAASSRGGEGAASDRNGKGAASGRGGSRRVGAPGSHAGSGAKCAEILSALRETKYKKQHSEQKGEWVPSSLPAHVVVAIAPNEKFVIAKLPRKNSDELFLLKQLSSQKSPHNHVIPLLDVIPSTLGQLIILPRMTRLSTDIYKNKFVQLSHELVEGIAFLHRHKVAHLDIKPDNLVFDFESKRLYIIDFDIAMQCKDVEEMVVMSCGTRGWTAPEIDKKPSCAFSPIRADLWACGNVLLHFAKQADRKDRDIALLTKSLMEEEPRRRPLLHELVDETPDFWTSRRLSLALERHVRGEGKKRPYDSEGAKSGFGPHKKVRKATL